MTITNIPARSINDLGVVPKEIIPKDMTTLKDVKVPVGNLPLGMYGESFNIEVFAKVLGFFITSPTGLGISKGAVVDLVQQETKRAMTAEDLLRKGITETNYGSGKAYLTVATAEADQANIPANTPVIVTNDPEAGRNGVYTWTGSSLIKSDFDYFEMAKAYVNGTYSIPDKRIVNELSAIKNIFASLTTNNPNKYLFSVRGRYFKSGGSDIDHGFDRYTKSYVNTGLIYLRAGATFKTRLLQQNKNNTADVSSLIVFDMDLKPIMDLSVANTSERDLEWMDYEYTAERNCYIVATSIRWEGSRDLIYATTENNGIAFNEFTVRTYYDRYLIRQLANIRFSNAKRLMDKNGVLRFEFNEAEKIFTKEDSPEGNSDLAFGGDIYNHAYRTTGYIPLEIGDYIKATVLNPDSNIQAMAIYDINFNVIRTEKATAEETGIAGDSYPWEYEFQAEQRCYVNFCTINPAARPYVNDVTLGAELHLANYSPTYPRLRITEDTILKRSNLQEIISSKIEERIPFLGEGYGYTELGVRFTQEVNLAYWNAYTGTGLFPISVGDTIDAQINTDETGGIMSALNIYDENKNFVKCIHTIREFGSVGNTQKANIHYVSTIQGYASVTSITDRGYAYLWVMKNWKSKLTKKVFPENKDVVSETLFTLPKPTSIIKLDFIMETSVPPTSKADGSFNCDVKINCDGVVINSKAKFAVQGSSSATYPKKNWSFDFFTDDTYSKDRAIKIGDLIPQTSLVWKANYIDATHSRNILTNRLWEEMVQTRKGFPKREVNVSYVNKLGIASLDTDATGHVDGYPCVVTMNGSFYGIGTLNIGKKRDNYNLDKDNKKHVQFELLGGGIDFTAQTPPYEKLGLRNPKLKGYEEGYPITDATVAGSMQALWDFHRLPLPERTAKFDEYYDRTNMVDWYMLISFTAAADLLDKNSILTTWDGKKYCWMPYDLDTTFGIHWAGTGLGYDTNWDWDTNNIIPIIKPIIINDAIKRYAELRNNGVFTLETVYRLNRDIESKFTTELFKKENTKWTEIPSKDFGGINQIMTWLRDRIKFLDAKFNYLDEGVLAQKLWNPPILASGASQTTTLNVPNIALGTSVKADYSMSLQGTKMTAAVTSVGVVTITHTNSTGADVNLDYAAIRVLKGN